MLHAHEWLLMLLVFQDLVRCCTGTICNKDGLDVHRSRTGHIHVRTYIHAVTCISMRCTNIIITIHKGINLSRAVFSYVTLMLTFMGLGMKFLET